MRGGGAGCSPAASGANDATVAAAAIPVRFTPTKEVSDVIVTDGEITATLQEGVLSGPGEKQIVWEPVSRPNSTTLAWRVRPEGMDPAKEAAVYDLLTKNNPPEESASGPGGGSDSGD